MNRTQKVFQSLTLFALAGITAWAQTGAAATGTATGAAASQASAAGKAASVHAQSAMAVRTAFRARLRSKLDTRHARVGQQVVAQTTAAVKEHGRVILPKGARLLGRVTAVQTAANSHARSSLGVVFDQAVLHNGRRLPMQATIAAIFAAQPYARFDNAGMAGPPMLNGGVSSALSGAAAVTGSGGATPATTGAGASGAAGLGSAIGSALGASAGAAGNAAGNVGASAGAAAGGMAGTAGNATANLGASNGLGVGLNGAANAVFQSSNGVPVRIELPAAAMSTGAAHASATGLANSAILLVSQSGNFTLNSGTQLEMVTTPASVSAGANATAGSSASVQ